MTGLSSKPSGALDDTQRTSPMTQREEPAVIFEDDSLIIVEKPSGMPSVPGLDGKISLHEWLENSLNPISVSCPTSHTTANSLHQVHRLDMDTSGVMVFAKTAESAADLRKQFEEHSVRKTYMARICGKVETRTGHISLPLSADYDERPRQKVDLKQGKMSYTEYRTICTNPDDTTEILLFPHTGRTHQLRVHCAHALGLNMPIAGDLLYGAHPVKGSTSESAAESSTSRNNPDRLCLHALSITFRHPSSGREVTFESSRLCYRKLQ